LIAAAQTPLAAPSANRFGRISPTSAQDVLEELGTRIDFILDGGRCEIGVESTIVFVAENGDLILLRPGGLSPEKIEAVAGIKLRTRPAAGGTDGIDPDAARSMPAPGMLESHYAPTKKLWLLRDSLEDLTRAQAATPTGKNRLESLLTSGGGILKASEKNIQIALLTLFEKAESARKRFLDLTGRHVDVYTLSRNGTIEEAAQNLFHTLREMDRSDASLLISEPCEIAQGLGYAIGDRLRRASAG
jgi:L-threonylcarbamoyladenylate synthase